MEHLYEKALESAEYIKTHTKKRPKIAVVLGSGLGKLTADFTDTEELSYKDIPQLPRYPRWQDTKAHCWLASWGTRKSTPWKAASISMRATP